MTPLDAMKQVLKAFTDKELSEAITNLRAAIKAMEDAEPVAWLIPGTITRDAGLAKANGANAKPLYQPVLNQEYVERALHYPECWDTAAYPTVWDALIEVTGTFMCSNEDTHPASAVPKDWQPIETAPKDGNLILVTDGVDVVAGYWDFALCKVVSDLGDILTHWMPLPAAPKFGEK